MKQHHIPLDGLQSGRTRVLLVDAPSEIMDVLTKVLSEQANYEVHTADSGFAAGGELRKSSAARDAAGHAPRRRQGRRHPQARPRPFSDLQMTKVVAMSNKLTDGQATHLLHHGFDGYLKKPFHVRQVIEAIEDAVAVVY